MSIHFTKMHGLGNDFVVINAIKQNIILSQLSIPLLGDRHQGIGFDQLLLIEPSRKANIFCRIFNADGSEAEQCGNGLRCIARFLHENKLCSHTLTIETKAGTFPITIHDYDHIKVSIPAPHFLDHALALNIKQSPHKIICDSLSLGNPHAILKITSLDHTDVTSLGVEISTHSHFPHGANVGFLQINDASHITLRTFERGTGETHACGSNACAAVFAGIKNGWLKSPVTVEFRYGCLTIEYDEKEKLMHMIGPATHVFEGEVGLNNRNQ